MSHPQPVPDLADLMAGLAGAPVTRVVAEVCEALGDREVPTAVVQGVLADHGITPARETVSRAVGRWRKTQPALRVVTTTVTSRDVTPDRQVTHAPSPSPSPSPAPDSVTDTAAAGHRDGDPSPPDRAATAPSSVTAGAAAPVVWEFERDRHRALLLQVLEAEPGSRMREVAIGALERYEHERDQARRRWSPERRSWEQQHGMEQQHAHPVQARRPRPEIEMRIEP